MSVYFLASVGEVGSAADILQMLSLGSLSFISGGTFVKSGLLAPSQRVEDWVTGRSYEMRCQGKSLTFATIFVFISNFSTNFPQLL